MRETHRTGGLLVAVISWNGREWLPRCIGSVLTEAGPADEIMVVDNGSTDGSAAWIEEHHGGQVRLVVNEKNRGFAAACNQVLEELDAGEQEAALILNQDTWIETGTLKRIRRAVAEAPGFGLLSPVQLTYEGQMLDPPFQELVDEEGVAREDLRKEQVAETTEMIGAAMILPRVAMERAGGFDPVYFAYAEESDLIRRLRYHGLKVGIVGGARIHHHHTRGKVRRSLPLTLHIIKNGYLFRLKDPVPSFPRLVYRFLTRDLWQVMRNKGRIRDPRYLIATAGILVYVLLTLPRTWWVRRKERRGRMHA